MRRRSSSSTNTNGASAKPTAPTLELLEHHYGSEIGCDVVFLVGHSKDNCLRIPAHSHILKNATPVFEAMFSSRFFNQNLDGEGGDERCDDNQEGKEGMPEQIPVLDLDGKAFDNLMKYLYDIPLVLQSAETTIETLKAAHKYQCAGLVRKCVNHLISLISVENVLLITANVALLCGDFENLENLHRECSGRPGECIIFPQQLQRRLSEQNSELNIELDCAWLVYNCLDFIDRNGVVVLESEEIEDLDYATIYHIMSRDTLDVEESLVFTAVARWADKECKRRHLPLTRDSKRSVLQDLLYLPRYLRMNSADFLAGPAQSNLLSKEEIETLTHVIQIGPDTFITSPSSPNSSPYKRIQTLGIPASKSLRIHLGHMLRPRRAPGEQRNGGNGNNNDRGGSGSNGDGNWKWIARLKKMRCCLLCGESGGGSGSVNGDTRGGGGGSRCVGGGYDDTTTATPSLSSSPVRRSSSGGDFVDRDHLAGALSHSSSSYSGMRRDPNFVPHKPGFVERAVVIFACLLD